MTDWLSINRGNAPLVLAFPHTGTDIPADIEARLVSPDLARKDADWWIDKLYAFGADMGATMVRTSVSRSVIDVNRDPSGVSLYPGQATTGLCPVTTFDGEPLYCEGEEPDEAEIEDRKAHWFAPYHEALSVELDRLRQAHGHVVLYDCHSIRSVIPRLFDGELPHFNIGTNNGTTCAPELEARILSILSHPGEGASGWTRPARPRIVRGTIRPDAGPVGKAEETKRSANQRQPSHLGPGLRRGGAGGWEVVANGRFKGGWTTRHYGRPAQGYHAIQMELACRGYLDEPIGPDPHPWPVPFDPEYARPMTAILTRVIQSCLEPL
ncbi:MAG: N-formylglutamate deformylase [Sphingomonas sp.]